MRKGIMVLVLMVCLMLFSGCLETLAAVGAGGIAGKTLAGYNQGVEDEIAAENAKREQLLEQMKNTNDETEKDTLRAQLASKDKKIADLLTAKEVGEVANVALGVNWSDTSEVASIGGMGILALLNYLQRGKTKKESQKYKAHKAGVNKFMVTHKDSRAALYADIGDERAKLKVQ